MARTAELPCSIREVQLLRRLERLVRDIFAMSSSDLGAQWGLVRGVLKALEDERAKRISREGGHR
jgi:hypothetical protein